MTSVVERARVEPLGEHSAATQPAQTVESSMAAMAQAGYSDLMSNEGAEPTGGDQPETKGAPLPQAIGTQALGGGLSIDDVGPHNALVWDMRLDPNSSRYVEPALSPSSSGDEAV
jgi:hypothetical protein